MIRSHYLHQQIIINYPVDYHAIMASFIPLLSNKYNIISIHVLIAVILAKTLSFIKDRLGTISLQLVMMKMLISNAIQTYYAQIQL